MAKVTSKLQITIPKALAERFGIAPGDEIDWRAAPDAIHVVPQSGTTTEYTTDERLAIFDAATERQEGRQERRAVESEPGERGWRREELYERGRPR